MATPKKVSVPKKLKHPGQQDFGHGVKKPTKNPVTPTKARTTIDQRKMPSNIYEALLMLQKRNIKVARNGTGKSQGGKEYKYATLDDTLQALRPVFDELGIGFTQPIVNDQIITELFHVDQKGEVTKITSTMPLGKPLNMQDYGARITYGRRYSITTATGISVEDDLDAIPAVKVPDAPAETVGEALGGRETDMKTEAVQLIGTSPDEVVIDADKGEQVLRTVPFTKALSAIDSAYSIEAVQLIGTQIQKSDRLNDSEKQELITIANTKLDTMDPTK